MTLGICQEECGPRRSKELKEALGPPEPAAFRGDCIWMSKYTWELMDNSEAQKGMGRNVSGY